MLGEFALLHADESIFYSNDFPLTTLWNKFSLGVRWLGPDLCFFKDLKADQSSRVQEQMKAWGKGLRREIAEKIGETLRRRFGRHSTIFLSEEIFSSRMPRAKF